MEHYYTVQGEGFHQGRAAYFIRLGGCDVGCTWCDVKESWPVEVHPHYTVNEIVSWVKSSHAKLCVVTGGEPLMHQLDELTSGLLQEGIEVNIETSGAYPLSGKWDWICVSPKRFKLPLPALLNSAHELKVVIAHKNDLRFAEKYAALVESGCKLYLQPEWDVRNEVTPLIVDYVKQNPQWRISLQIHKYLQIP